MGIHRLAAAVTVLAARLHDRATRARGRPDEGSHTLEYAIGLGLAAGITLTLYASFKTKLASVVSNWFFG